MFFNARTWLIAPLLFGFFLTETFAVEAKYSASLILTAYDNVTRVPDPVGNELSSSLRGTAAVHEDTSGFTGRFVSSLELVKYHKKLIADETIGRLLADAIWRIQPNRFEWFISDTFTQTAVDSLAKDVPGNRKNVNAFSTGPNYIVRINRRNTLNFKVRGSDFRYERNNTDNNRVSVLGNWIYDINNSINIGLNAEKEDVNYADEINNSNYEREDAYFQLNYKKRRSSVTLEYGETSITNELGDYDKASRYLFDYKSARRQDATSRLVIRRKVSDISGDVLDQVDENAVFNENAVNSDVFINESARFTHKELFRSAALTFNAYKTTDKYDVLINLDNEEKGVSLSGNWDSARNSRFTMQATHTNTIYNNLLPLREDDDAYYSLLYSYTFRRNTRLNFEVSSFGRVSSIDTETYNDNRIIISLTYVSI